MTYKETEAYLFSMLPMYQRNGKAAYKEDLTNTIKLLDYLDNPHTKFKSVHIAGTNGKGSSSHGIASILQTAGYRTGLYTSPHLISFTERIQIDGIRISENDVIDFVNRMKPAIEEIEPSFFEMTVALAFDYFSKEKVDIAIIETGLGGRLDSTNVISPEVCLITNIGFDHSDILGDTLSEIAAEKAGIIKKDTPVVLGQLQPEILDVFDSKAAQENAKLIPPKQLPAVPNYPYYKTANMPGILGVVDELRSKGWKIDEDHVREGLDEMELKTGFRGRMERLAEKPTIIADISHNKEGLELLFKHLSSEVKGDLHIIFGTVKNKPLEPIFDVLPLGAKYYWTQSSVPRSLSSDDLINNLPSRLMGPSFKDVNSALKEVKKIANEDDLVLVTGSTFLVADLLHL